MARSERNESASDDATVSIANEKQHPTRHPSVFFAGHLSRAPSARPRLGVSSPGFGRADRRDPYLGRVRRAGVLRDGEDGEVEAARFRGDDRLDGAVGIPGVQRERLRGEKRWGVSEHSRGSRNGEAPRWGARRALSGAQAAPPRGARRGESRGRRTIVVSRSSP